MSGLLGNNNNKNTQENVTDGATGVAKTGTGSKNFPLGYPAPAIFLPLTHTPISVLGDTLSGVTNTVGGVVGGASRGLGETVSGVTSQAGKPLGDGISNVGTSVQGTGEDVSKAARDAGQWKTN